MRFPFDSLSSDVLILSTISCIHIEKNNMFFCLLIMLFHFWSFNTISTCRISNLLEWEKKSFDLIEMFFCVLIRHPTFLCLCWIIQIINANYWMSKVLSHTTQLLIRSNTNNWCQLVWSRQTFPLQNESHNPTLKKHTHQTLSHTVKERDYLSNVTI